MQNISESEDAERRCSAVAASMREFIIRAIPFVLFISRPLSNSRDLAWDTDAWLPINFHPEFFERRRRAWRAQRLPRATERAR